MSERLKEVRVRTTAVTAVVLMCTACAVPADPPPPRAVPVPAAPPPAATMAAVARDIVEEVNRTRQANGLRPLRDDTALRHAAREHSEELAVRRTLDHTSTNPARRTLAMRIDAAGGSWSRTAENLGKVTGPASNVAAQMVQMWLDSEGHRRNMLEAAYTHTGVGVAIDHNGIWYITQLYVLPRSNR